MVEASNALGPLLLTAAYLSCVLGLAWLALAMEPHWQQVRATQPLPAATALTLRVLGGLGLLASLVLCLLADHITMAPLVWVMALAGGALTVALVLAWRPRLLAPLLAWVPTSRAGA
jgi:hypothetical protein